MFLKVLPLIRKYQIISQLELYGDKFVRITFDLKRKDSVKNIMVKSNLGIKQRVHTKNDNYYVYTSPPKPT